MTHDNTEKRMSAKQASAMGLLLALAALIVVFAAEQFLKPDYARKSLIKVLAFGGAVVLYAVLTGKRIKDVICLYKPRQIRSVGIWMLCFVLGTAAAFLLFRENLDLRSLRQSLMTKEQLTKENCLFVFIYIVFCNAFLEEIFFRGFVSGLFSGPWCGRIAGAVLFSLYHIGIFITWFEPLIFTLCVAGLVLVGLFLRWLCEKHGSILAGYMTHACANVVINGIGVLLIFEWI